MVLYTFAATKGVDFNKALSRIGLEAFVSWRRNSPRNERLNSKKTPVRRREDFERFSAMKFNPSMRKRTAPKKKEAPTKSMWGRERTFESFRRTIIRAIRTMPMGKLI